VIRRVLGRIGVRLVVVNLVVLLVPVAGLEFARIYETQLLGALERDMKDQSALVRAEVEQRLAEDPSQDMLDVADPVETLVTRAARTTRTRVRVLDADGAVIVDSHREGPPEGAEQDAPSVLGRSLERAADDVRWRGAGPVWPDVPEREEVRGALAGNPTAKTRVRARAPAVLLFVAEPIRVDGEVRGAVYVTRSTQPVLLELYRIRSGLIRVLAVALLVTGGATLLLAWSISRPLSKLSKAARRVAAGELRVEVPAIGSGEVRELADAFRAMKERLLERLRFSSDFAADVAHELKSPLTSIRGAAELLGEGAWQDDAARARFLRNIELDVDRLDALVSRLLLLGRIEASELPITPLDVLALAKRVAERVADETARVEVRCEGEPPIVPGREADLETAVQNLVENAQRYSPPGAVVTVRLARTDSGGASLSVVDRGPGVPAANLAKVWGRFFTTDAERGGTGLGLAIVKTVVEAHGGAVSCVSPAGGGATFTILLPGMPRARKDRPAPLSTSPQ